MAKGGRGRKGGGRERILLTPDTDGTFVSLSNPDKSGRTVWRKRILPEGEINYEGERVVFDRPYLKSLASSFDAKALDQTAFQLAPANNAHTMDPERTRGEVVGMGLATPDDVDGPGLYANFVMHTKKADRLLARNPRLGVSCQIREGIRRVDGARFPRAVRHVLGTLDPRVVQLGQWRAVSLSNDDDGRVIDLTGARFEEISVAKSGGKRKAAADDDLQLTEADAEAAIAAALSNVDPDDIAAGGKGKGTEKPGGKRMAKAAKGRKARRTGKAGKGVKLSNADDGGMLSLAARVTDLSLAHEQTQIDLAESRWETLRGQLVGRVPKAILDLAAPVMSSASGTVLELSNADGDETVDAVRLIGEILAEVADSSGMDLSEPDGISDDPSDQEGQQVAAVLDEWRERSGS